MVLHGVLGRARASTCQAPYASALEFPAALCKNHFECPRLCQRGTHV